MALNDYVLVVGPEWTEVPNIIGLTLDMPQLDDWCKNQEWNNLTGWMESVGILPENGPLVSNARLVGVDGQYRFWFIL